MLTLTSCSKTMDTAAINPIQGAQTFCDIAKPITWSSRDTPETIAEVKEHNAVFIGICKGK